MTDVVKKTGFVILSLALTGCAARNYDFAAVPDGPSRVTELVGGLDQLKEQSEAGEKELYDISLFPLVHSRMHVFAENDETDTPVKFIEADVDSYLPLFGFVDATVSRFDQDRQLLNRHEFDSSLWGAFRNHREVIATRAGSRETTRHTFLWLFNWCGEERWHPVAH